MDINILRLIFDYSIKKKNADREFVERLIDIVVNSNELHDYVRELFFYEENAKDASKYIVSVLEKYLES